MFCNNKFPGRLRTLRHYGIRTQASRPRSTSGRKGFFTRKVSRPRGGAERSTGATEGCNSSGESYVLCNSNIPGRLRTLRHYDIRTQASRPRSASGREGFLAERGRLACVLIYNRVLYLSLLYFSCTRVLLCCKSVTVSREDPDVPRAAPEASCWFKQPCSPFPVRVNHNRL